MATINTTIAALSGGLDAVAGQGEKYTLTFGGVGVAGDKITLLMTDASSGLITQYGAGNITGLLPNYCQTFNNKVYMLAGPTTYFSAVGQPTLFNDPNGTGNGFVTMTNFYATPEDLVALSPYQGRLAFFSRNTVQIWSTPANPATWAQTQILPNIGTFAPLSVQPIGDLDVMFLSDTGIRSLRVRDSSNNAFVNDIGSPVDLAVAADLIASGAAKTAACAIVEPSANRYWLLVNGKIYVLSYFPNNKIAAWSTYTPSYYVAGVLTPFTPIKFIVHAGQVYCRDANNVWLYGGTGNNTYDATIASIETPWYDAKTPGTFKTGKAIDATFTGNWTFSAGSDYTSGTLQVVATNQSNSTFDGASIGYTGYGTHFKLKAVTTGSTAATFSGFLFHYEPRNTK